MINFIETGGMTTFRVHVFYISTGVPWAPPQVTHVEIDGVPDKSGPVPLQGGVKAKVFGAGFAKSAFAKCFVTLPDAPSNGRRTIASINCGPENSPSRKPSRSTNWSRPLATAAQGLCSSEGANIFLYK